MIKYQRTQSSIFLMEILINILMFSVLCACSLQLFMKSHDLTEKTTTLHQAATACSNVAAIFEASDGTVDTILEAYPYALHTDAQIIIFFDSNHVPCERGFSSYHILAEKTQEHNIQKLQIQFYAEEILIYEITACNYTPLDYTSWEENREEVVAYE